MIAGPAASARRRKRESFVPGAGKPGKWPRLFTLCVRCFARDQGLSLRVAGGMTKLAGKEDEDEDEDEGEGDDDDEDEDEADYDRDDPHVTYRLSGSIRRLSNECEFASPCSPCEQRKKETRGEQEREKGSGSVQYKFDSFTIFEKGNRGGHLANSQAFDQERSEGEGNVDRLSKREKGERKRKERKEKPSIRLTSAVHRSNLPRSIE